MNEKLLKYVEMSQIQLELDIFQVKTGGIEKTLEEGKKEKMNGIIS
jgi:hypothetical protein